MTFRRSVQLSVFASRCLCSGAELATWDCGEMAARDPGQESHPVCGPGSASQIIYAWAMDAPELELPPGVGFRVGGGSSIKYLVLQVHYASTDYIDAAGDDSGVILRCPRCPAGAAQDGGRAPAGHRGQRPGPLHHLLRDLV